MSRKAILILVFAVLAVVSVAASKPPTNTTASTPQFANASKCDTVGLNPSEVNIHGGSTGIEECEEHEATFANEAKAEAAKGYVCRENTAPSVIADCEADEGH